MDSWPQETQRHYLRYRKSGPNWLIDGPWLATRASLRSSTVVNQQAPLAIDADERIVLPAGADVKASDTIVCIETNATSMVQSAVEEPGFVEAYLKRQKTTSPLPAMFS